MTNYTPNDILNFIKELLKDDTNLVSVTMSPKKEPLLLNDGGAELIGVDSIKIEFKDVNKSDCFRTVHDSLKDYLKDNGQSFNLVIGSGNTLLVLLL
ncbi:hypothetical protein E4K67_12450 [Desulfosporosinus fructosivorans]|uniref:Uncharacterized protein n=1 Tax=Desulfosporosinus fructosivorans TaxID=2018669 RepID=A0A4Z0R429_9FIRM|nr:hypothetical protein [Desulfosporosinus fructosivorans]TGE37548.1 hypothetical protein E4K67_12450 [Desulfosporosinus fructosivorans]